MLLGISGRSDKMDENNDVKQRYKIIEKNIRTRLTRKGYHIEVDSISRDTLNKIIEELTVTPYKLDATKEEMEKTKFSVYTYSKDRLEIIVPRYYGINKFGPPQDSIFDSADIDLQFHKQLREIQLSVTDRCLDYMRKNGGGLLSVPCGFGKTVCALYIAYRLGLKTLVVVHKSFLIKQWIDRAMEFLSISEDRIGIIRQNRCDVKDKDLIIGMIHTIAKREYQNVFDGVGLVIYDEAHHVACKFFSKALMKTGAQYTLALTATPYRGDGLIKVMYWFTGGTMYREQMKMNKNVIVKVVNHKSSDNKLFALKRRWLKGKMRSDTGKMTTNICKIGTRNKILIDMITHIRRTEPERKILVLSGRRDHLDILKKGVDKKIREDIDKGLIDEEEVYSCYYIGTTKPADRQEAEERGDIIFATFDMANEGLDIKHLNTVFLASPKKDVIQAIGRIMRTILKTGDIRPMIVDFADDIHTLAGWLTIRKQVYKKCKYEIEDYYLKDDKFITSYEYNGVELSPQDYHHKDPYINNAINSYNLYMNVMKDDMDKAREICLNLDRFFKPDMEPTPVKKYPALEKEYIIHDDLEYTNLSDILFVQKLTEKDFNTKVLKDVDLNTDLNLEKDMEYDKDEIENQISLKTLLSKDKRLVIPKKRMF